MATIPVTVEPAPEVVEERTGLTSGADGEETIELREQLLRTAAELDNLRKRSRKRVEEERRREREAVVKEFLEVVDTMDLALATTQDGDPNAWVEGMRAVRRQTLDTLGRLGVEPFSPEGETFDPTRHEAVECRATGGDAENRVVEVIRPGYRMEDGAVLRTARVVVA